MGDVQSPKTAAAYVPSPNHVWHSTYSSSYRIQTLCTEPHTYTYISFRVFFFLLLYPSFQTENRARCVVGATNYSSSSSRVNISRGRASERATSTMTTTTSTTGSQHSQRGLAKEEGFSPIRTNYLYRKHARSFSRKNADAPAESNRQVSDIISSHLISLK